MKKLFFAAVILAIIAAFFASTLPDGLDFVAGKMGFAQNGQPHKAFMPDYNLKIFPDGGFSTALAGIAGILILLGIFWLTAFIIKKNKNIIGKSAIIFMAALWVSPAFAARPLLTDDFYTVTPGGYELELGYFTTHGRYLLDNFFDLSFRKGIWPNFDFAIEIPYTTSNPSGPNDIYLHAKYRFWERSQNEGMTIRIDYKFNNGNPNQGLGSGDNDYWLLLIYSKMYGNTKAHANLGYINVGINAGRQSDDYYLYSVAVEQPVWEEKGEIVAEYVANTAAVPNPAFVQLGARYIVASGLKLDAAYSYGLNANTIINDLTAGIHYEF